MKRILIVAAHPDDEVLGMGGTIAKYAMNGDSVAVLIVTDGSSSQYRNSDDLEQIIKNKKKETQEVARILGISRVYYGNLPDMKLDATAHIYVNNAIEKVIDSFAPDTVYTHFPGDINKDHECVYKSTLVACRPIPGQTVKELYSYSVPSSTEWNVQNTHNVFTPNVFVDISGECEKKKYSAMLSYSTELRDYPHLRSVEALKILDRAVGVQVGMECAESFILHRCIR